MFIICQNEKDFKKKTLEKTFNYSLYMYNYNQGVIVMSENFVSGYIKSPMIISLTPKQEFRDNPEKILLMIYDDENTNDSELGYEKFYMLL